VAFRKCLQHCEFASLHQTGLPGTYLIHQLHRIIQRHAQSASVVNMHAFSHNPQACHNDALCNSQTATAEHIMRILAQRANIDSPFGNSQLPMRTGGPTHLVVLLPARLCFTWFDSDQVQRCSRCAACMLVRTITTHIPLIRWRVCRLKLCCLASMRGIVAPSWMPQHLLLLESRGRRS
jgi:hypothetical protein